MAVVKLVLAAVRGDNFTHAGESEAIDMVLQNLVKDPAQQLLDVGSGLGGTAAYIQNKGFGQVTGIDIDANMISYANANYPGVNFYHHDVAKSKELFTLNQFDAVYHFNSFYAFAAQDESLRNLNYITKPSGKMVIFDYLALENYDKINPFSTDHIFTPVDPINTLKRLEACNWEVDEFQDLSAKYLEWYQVLVTKLEDMRQDLVNQFGVAEVEHVHNNFTHLIKAIAEKKLGGCVIYATNCK